MNTFEAKEPQISRNRDSFRSGLKIKDTHLRQSCTPLFLIQFQNASTTALHESNPNCHAYSLRERESESARNFYNFILYFPSLPRINGVSEKEKLLSNSINKFSILAIQENQGHLFSSRRKIKNQPKTSK